MMAAHRIRARALSTHPWTRRAIALAIVASAAACRVDDPVGIDAATPPAKSLSSAAAATQGQYIVVLRDSVADVEGAATRVLRGANANIARGRVYGRVLKGFSAAMSEEAANALRENPAVAFVEADQVVTAASSGTQSPAPWATDRIDQRTMPLSGSYSWSSTGAGVNVYILDSGIRTTHTQFGGRARSVYGASGDVCGHGTYVAGLVGSATYGSAKGANLLSIQVLDYCDGLTKESTGSASAVLGGLDWLAANRVLPAVANMSFTLSNSASVNQAVNNVINAGVTVVAAAGNSFNGENTDACAWSPASVPGAITVGGSQQGDAMASWSKRGACVDLFAPGHDVYSTGSSSDTHVTIMTGSSSSAGLAAGAAAMYLETNPSASPATVASALIGAATTGVMSGLDGASPNRLLYTGAAGGGGGGGGGSPPPPPPVDNAPTARITSISCRKTACTYDGTGSTDDKGIVQYSWSFGDNTSSSAASSGSPTTTHTYGAAGTYTVRLTVTDTAGQTAVASATVTVNTKGR